MHIWVLVHIIYLFKVFDAWPLGHLPDCDIITLRHFRSARAEDQRKIPMALLLCSVAPTPSPPRSPCTRCPQRLYYLYLFQDSFIVMVTVQHGPVAFHRPMLGVMYQTQSITSFCHGKFFHKMFEI